MRAWRVRIAIAICAFAAGLTVFSLANVYVLTEEPPPAVTQACSEVTVTASDLPSASLLPTPTYCDLVKRADCYDGQVLRFHSKLGFGDEGIYFYDDSCAGEGSLTAGELYGINYKDFERLLIETCDGSCDGPLDVVVSGRFEKVTPSNKSNLLWDIYPLHFRIIAVEKASKAY